MTAEGLLQTLVGVLVVVYAFVAFGAYLRKRGPRLILPDAEEPGASVGARHAVAAASAGSVHTSHVHSERTPAAQALTGASTVLRNWFAGKTCAICEKPIASVHRRDQHPGLMTSTNEVISWEEVVHDEHLTERLASHKPVCSNCVMSETFRRQYPELVLDRPEHRRNEPSTH